MDNIICMSLLLMGLQIPAASSGSGPLLILSLLSFNCRQQLFVSGSVSARTSIDIVLGQLFTQGMDSLESFIRENEVLSLAVYSYTVIVLLN